MCDELYCIGSIRPVMFLQFASPFKLDLLFPQTHSLTPNLLLIILHAWAFNCFFTCALVALSPFANKNTHGPSTFCPLNLS